MLFKIIPLIIFSTTFPPTKKILAPPLFASICYNGHASCSRNVLHKNRFLGAQVRVDALTIRQFHVSLSICFIIQCRFFIFLFFYFIQIKRLFGIPFWDCFLFFIFFNRNNMNIFCLNAKNCFKKHVSKYLFSQKKMFLQFMFKKKKQASRIEIRSRKKKKINTKQP